MSTKDTHTGGDPLRGVLETVLESAKKKIGLGIQHRRHETKCLSVSL